MAPTKRSAREAKADQFLRRAEERRDISDKARVNPGQIDRGGRDDNRQHLVVSVYSLPAASLTKPFDLRFER